MVVGLVSPTRMYISFRVRPVGLTGPVGGSIGPAAAERAKDAAPRAPAPSIPAESRARRLSAAGSVAAESALSGGFQYTVRGDQKWALGIGWAKPSRETNGDEAEDEYVIEMSYNFQIAKNFALLPDLQVIIDPLDNPEEDRVWVLGLRAILTF